MAQGIPTHSDLPSPSPIHQPSPTASPTAPVSPTPLSTVTPVVLTPTPTPVLAQGTGLTDTITLPTPTPTPTPVLPAQSPPERILAPAIGLDAPIDRTSWEIVERNGMQTSSWIIPEEAAGWHANSALPGHGNNVVLSGHHNLGSEVFRNLVDLQPGDEITLKADGHDYDYAVTDRFILPERDVSEEQRRQNFQWIMPTVDERVTLVTCWPYSDNSHRLIVIAKPLGVGN